MFDPAAIRTLAHNHEAVLRDLVYVEQQLNQHFHDMSAVIRALILAVASDSPLLLIGKPGTAKSRIIRVFCGLVGVLDLAEIDKPDNRDDRYFEYLLTPFTEPSELFGYYDIAKAKEGRMERIEDNMMQRAEVVYLDEVFNASSAILNTLLAFMNERYFHDRGKRKPVKLKSLFAATNHVPDSAELLAVYDRFVLRCHVENAEPEPDDIAKLLRAGWQTTYSDSLASLQPRPKLLDGLESFRTAIRARSADLAPKTAHGFYGNLAALVRHARIHRLSEVSNRRLVKMSHIMLIDRMYQAVVEGHLRTATPIELGERQLRLFPEYFLDHFIQPGDKEQAAKMLDLAYVES
ncbi:MAG: AAA domain-containing protein [Oscillochloris sp.]|nr:AAA domain-containing protein [Oscillochloris sp.]